MADSAPSTHNRRLMAQLAQMRARPKETPLRDAIEGFVGVEPESVMDVASPDARRYGEAGGILSDAIGLKGLLTAGIIPALKLGSKAAKPMARLSAQEGRRGDVSSVMLNLQESNVPPELLARAAKHEAASPGFAEARPYLSPAELSKAARSSQTPSLFNELMTTLPPAEELAAVARAGEAKRGWYAGSRAASRDVYGDEATRMAYLKAALSPQTSVEGNLENALKVNRGWEAAGRPTDAQSIGRVLGENVQQQPLADKSKQALAMLAGRFGLDPRMPREALVEALGRIDPDLIRQASVLEAWVPNTGRALRGETLLSGPKVDSFGANLDPANPFAPLHVTNDTWMARLGGYPQTKLGGSINPKMGEPGYGPTYSAASARTRQAGDLMGWAPEEVQETAWSWAKPVGEGAGKVGIVVPPSTIQAVPDFQTLLQQDRYLAKMTPAQRARAESMPQGLERTPAPFKPSRAQAKHLERARQRVIESYLREE